MPGNDYADETVYSQSRPQHSGPGRPLTQFSMKRLLSYVGIWSLAVLTIIVLWMTVLSDIVELVFFRNNKDIQAAKIEQILRNITFYGTGKRIYFILIPSVILLLAVIYIIAVSWSKLKQASVHTYKIGKHNEVVVSEKDLSLAAPIAMGLMNAEQLKQMHGGLEQAFNLYTQLAEVQTRQIKALGGRFPQIPLQAPQQELPPAPVKEVPTFQKLLLDGEIARGRPMILGYENGLPRRGSFLDIYSAAVAGESGSGKTATLLFLIGSGLVSGSVRFIGIDPHYPHPKSLGFKTKPLWETGLMRMATYKDDMLAVLSDIERTIDNRLKQVDKDSTPVVLVIDELAFLAKTSIAPAIAHTMERISTEGRKCAVYMLASSQTWLVSRTGPSSVVRDTLTSAYVHRIKPKQANLLLQDKEEADKVKKYVKQAGEVLLCPVNDDSVVCKMPLTTTADMKTVADMLGETQARTRKRTDTISLDSGTDIDAEFRRLVQDIEPAELPDPEQAKQATHKQPGLRERMKELLAEKIISYGDIRNNTGIARSTVFNFVKQKGGLKPEQKIALETYIAQIEQSVETPV